MKAEVINLNRESRELIEGMIQAGDYKSQDEVVSAALKGLAGNTNAKIKRLRALIMDGENSGPPEEYNGEAHLAELKRKYNGL